MKTHVKPLSSFSEILGQDKPKKILRQTLERGKIPHAYLFTGIPGIGKISMARVLTMALNCHKLNDGEVCGQCKPCRQIKNGTFTEFIIVRPRKSDVSIFEGDPKKGKRPTLIISIDHIRELERVLAFAPLDKYRVCVVDQAEKMTLEAANAFLKTLEEPPPGNILILKTEDPNYLLPTILSRCQRIAFQPLHVQDSIDWLIENKELDKDKAMLLAKLSAGSLGRAVKMLDGDFLNKREEWLLMIIKFFGQSKIDAINEMDLKCVKEDKYKSLDLSETGEVGIMDMVGVWEQWYRDLLLMRLGNQENLLINVDYSRKLKSIAGRLKVDNLIDCIEAIEKARQNLTKNINPKTAMGEMVLTLKQLTG